mmetsp:Transcript_158047/g.503195  ORF Transcript_158047/g.503195 Transcript_158047/m.503195 type:complete len:133 (+) Transcript_158047:774-1172(+)
MGGPPGFSARTSREDDDEEVADRASSDAAVRTTAGGGTSTSAADAERCCGEVRPGALKSNAAFCSEGYPCAKASPTPTPAAATLMRAEMARNPERLLATGLPCSANIVDIARVAATEERSGGVGGPTPREFA